MKEENEKLNIGIEEIRKIKLTTEEKSLMLGNILKHDAPEKPRERPLRSPYLARPLFTRFTMPRMVYQGLAFCLMVVVGGGMVSASKGSLPGNILYPLKVNVVEPVHGVFLFSTEAKIQYHGRLATERLIEAEKLESTNELDTAKETQISTLLKNHTEALNQAITDLRDEKAAQEDGEDSDGDNESAVTDFEANMQAHAKILDILNKDGNGGNEEEMKNEKGKTNVREAARESGKKIRKNLEESKDKNAEQYKKRKDSVKSIIDSTDINITREKEEDGSPDKLMILNGTTETLDKAKQSLEEAEEENKKGNLNGAYSKLLDSESSAKEAGILLEEGLKLDIKDSSEDSNFEFGEEVNPDTEEGDGQN